MGLAGLAVWAGRGVALGVGLGVGVCAGVGAGVGVPAAVGDGPGVGEGAGVGLGMGVMMMVADVGSDSRRDSGATAVVVVVTDVSLCGGVGITVSEVGVTSAGRPSKISRGCILIRSSALTGSVREMRAHRKIARMKCDALRKIMACPSKTRKRENGPGIASDNSAGCVPDSCV